MLGNKSPTHARLKQGKDYDSCFTSLLVQLFDVPSTKKNLHKNTATNN